MAKFLRRTWSRYSKLGKRRKKKQVWRRPTGRDNKMRERRKGYPARVEIGYKNAPREQIVVINNLKELAEAKEGIKVILGKMGQKKKIEMAKKAKERKIEFVNLNVGKFLKEIEDKAKKKIEEKKKAEEKAKKGKKGKGEKKSAADAEDKKIINKEETNGSRAQVDSKLTKSENPEPSGEAKVSEQKTSDGDKK